ncbi:MAG: MBL fold metallo-hydrolase [Chloroflexota bacterium]|nr:MAG: MBL fold metallo-hydrolase [Chloroflexota bacterium]
MQILPGIHHLHVPIPESSLGYLNAYLVKADDGNLLIDTGWNTDEAFGALVRQLGDAGVSLCDLRYIAITHVHPDHYGLAGRLLQHCDAKLVMHEIERPFLRSRYLEYANLLAEVDQWLRINGVPDEDWRDLGYASMPVLELVQVAMPHITVRGGEHLMVGDFDWEVVWTPGHSPGHVCFYESSRRVLVSGDHVLPAITPNISMHTQSMGNPLGDYLVSLQTVAALPVEIVLPSHGEPFRDLHKRVSELRDQIERRRQHVVAAAGEAKTAYQIAAEIPWNTKGVPWLDLPPLHKRAAVFETIAHIERLCAEGVLCKTIKGGTFWYAGKRSV